MSTNLQDYIELLTAEQHVQVDKLRESARNGVSPRVRGEVWMYLLGVLSSDKTSEMTSFKTLRVEYGSLPSTLPSDLTSLLLQTALAHHTRRFESPTYESLITTLTAEPGGGGATNMYSANSAGGGPPSATGSRSTTLSLPSGAGNSISPVLPAAPTHAPPPLSLDDRDAPAPFLRGKSFLIPPPAAPPSRHAFLALMEEVLGKYWHASGCHPRQTEVGRQVRNVLDGDTEPRERWPKGLAPAPADWVYLATPFVCCLARPIAVFYSFEKLMDKLKDFPPLPSRLGSMLGLFRLALPDLQGYFEDEQVPMVAVAMSWMTTLLSREMWLGDVLRLWDAYLASDNMFALHCYVCVAILMTCKETLEELDGSEAKLMLLDLPPMDVDRLLQDAANLKVQFPLPGPIEDDEEEILSE